MIYERKRGMQYLVVCGISRPDGIGGREIKPSLMADFHPISDNNQMGICDTRSTAIQFVNMEIASGKLAPSSRDKRTVEIDRQLQTFIENHPDYTREGGLGLINRQMTKEQRADELKKRAQALIDQANDLEAKVDELSEEELEKMTSPEKKNDGMAKAVEISTGGATVANARK